MSSQFECYVHISDQKYDIVINDLGLCVKFSDIYPKVQQIVKIGLNEDITFITHEFEIFEYMCESLNGSVVKSVDQLLLHKSRIRISRKQSDYTSLRPNPSASSLPQSEYQMCLNLIFPDEEKYLLEKSQEIKAYNSIVMAINIGWDLKSRSNNWEKVCQQLRTSSVTNSNKRSLFLQQNFYHWTNHYVETFYKLNNRICPQTQQLFNLLKIVHILDLDKLYDKYSCISYKLECISKLPESIEYYQKYLKDFRIEKLLSKESICRTNDSQNTDSNPIESQLHRQSLSSNQSMTTVLPKDVPIDSDTNIQTNTDVRPRVLTFKEKELISSEIDIKAYHSIVMAINVDWDLTTNSSNWNKVSKEMSKISKDYKSTEVCKASFRKWTLYYIQNFYKLDGKIESTSQKIFDLLKIVHILDLDKIYGKSNPIPKKIRDIFQKSEVQDYYYKHLRALWSKKTQCRELNTRANSNNWIERSSASPQTAYSPDRRRSSSQSSADRTDDRAMSDSSQLFSKSRVSLNKDLLRDKGEVHAFHQIVLTINIGWDMKTCSKNWSKVSQQMFGFTKRYSTPTVCLHTFYTWTSFYVQNYNNVNSESQKIFDLLKIVHILDLDKFYSRCNPILQQIKDISEKQEFIDYYDKYLKELRLEKIRSKEVEERDSMNVNDVRGYRSSSVSRSNGQPNSRSLLEEESQLKEDEDEIRDFYRIVLAINLGWDFFKRNRNWNKVSQTINRKEFSPYFCSETFYYWTRFYVKNYKKLNDRLEPSAQKIFDLLKVVHTLNIYKFDVSEETEHKIDRISSNYSFKSYFSQYLNEIRVKKVESKEDKDMAKEKRISKKHLSVYQTLYNEFKSTLNADNTEPNETPTEIVREESPTILSSSTSAISTCPSIDVFTPPTVSEETPNIGFIYENMTFIPNPVPIVPLPAPTVAVPKFIPMCGNQRRPFSQVFTYKPVVEKKGISLDDYMKRKDNSITSENTSDKSGEQTDENPCISILSERIRLLDPRLNRKLNSVKFEDNSNSNNKQNDEKSLISTVNQNTVPFDPWLRNENSVISDINNQENEESIPKAKNVKWIPIQSERTQVIDPRLKIAEYQLKRSLERSQNCDSDNQTENELNPNKRNKPNESDIIRLD